MSKTATEGVPLAIDTNKTSERPASISSLVGRLVYAIAKLLPPGDVAELRRLKPTNPCSPAFFRLMVSVVEPDVALPSDGCLRDEIERRWAIVFQAAATLVSFHQPKRSLGEALRSGGYSELRLVRLLRGQGDSLFKELRTCAHFLASKGEAVNVSDLAMLVLITDPEKSESLRRNIARRYYGNQAQKQKES